MAKCQQRGSGCGCRRAEVRTAAIQTARATEMTVHRYTPSIPVWDGGYARQMSALCDLIDDQNLILTEILEQLSRSGCGVL